MTEAQVGLLIKAASSLAQNKDSKTSQILKSYYLMRCKLLAKDSGLPKKQFSNEVRCSRCCIEWSDKTEIKLNPIKLSKRQKKRIKSKRRKTNESNCQKHLLHSNELIRKCSFCGKNSKTTFLKPNQITKTATTVEKQISFTNKIIVPKKVIKKPINSRNQEWQSSVYQKSKAAFLLKEKRNILQNTIKVAPSKAIKNNKKKKDKFAGLCKNAVVAVQLKKEKETKLNLFLKPSS